MSAHPNARGLGVVAPSAPVWTWVIVLLLMPYVVRFFASIHWSLMRRLLGPAAF